MAEEQDQPKSYFPTPPQFFQHFTEKNAKALDQTQERDPNATLRLLELPPELRYLIPPAEPVDGKWKNYGDIYELNPALPTLEDQGIERLYPGADDDSTASSFHEVPSHLNQIARSILANYLELLGILAVDPAQAEPKVKALRDLFINGEHLINLYRPHQARESLILMMEEQLDKKREVTRKVSTAKTKIDGVLGHSKVNLKSANGRGNTGVGGYNEVERLEDEKDLNFEEKKKQRTLWAALNELDE